MINELKQRTNENIDEITVEANAITILGSTIDNLKSAIAGEEYEYNSMYPEYANIADKEGYSAMAIRLRAIAVAEKHIMLNVMLKY